MKFAKSTLITLATLIAVTQFSMTGYAAEEKPVDPKKIMALYRRHCASCHGTDGKGDTKAGKKSGVKDYTDAKVVAELKDEKKAVKHILEGMKDEDGKTLMAPFNKKLKPMEAVGLVKFLKHFGAKKD